MSGEEARADARHIDQRPAAARHREIAEELWRASGEPARMVPFDHLSEAHQAEYLRMAPVVERYAAQRAAEALRQGDRERLGTTRRRRDVADRYAGMSSRWPEPTQLPAAPGGDEKAEAREQIATAIVDAWRVAPHNAHILEMARWFADAALAVPAVAEALAAVERVRALADHLDHVAVNHLDPLHEVADRLRRALDGST